MWVNSRCAIAAWLECFQEKPRTVSEWTGLPGEESVKRFERSNGLDTALYKTIPLPLGLPLYRCISVPVQIWNISIFKEEYLLWHSTDQYLCVLNPGNSYLQANIINNMINIFFRTVYQHWFHIMIKCKCEITVTCYYRGCDCTLKCHTATWFTCTLVLVLNESL